MPPLAGNEYLYQVLPPAVPLIFATTLAAIWHAQRRPYVALLAAAFAALSAGLASQILHVPAGVPANAVLSNLIYTLCASAFVCGLLLRAGRPMNVWLLLGIVGAINVAIVYFSYVDRNLDARIYVQNFGFGVLLLVAAFHLRSKRDFFIDRVLFWSVLVFGASFFLRTALTVGSVDSATASTTFGRSLFWLSLNFSLILFAIVLGLALLIAIAVDAIEDVRRDGGTDQLTQVLNRRGLEIWAASAFASEQTISLVICDIDHFKAVNDTYGHAAGDLVLAEFGRRLRDSARAGDAVARYGGEEFVMLLPGAGKNEAQTAAERVRSEIASYVFGDIAEDLRITASFGVAERRRGETLESLIRRADRRLYAAKRSGRNAIIARESATAGPVV